MRNRLDELARRPQGVFAYGVYDAISATVAEQEGHEVIYVGGYSAAGARGLPDMGLLTMTEMLEHIKFIAKAVHTPLMVDIDDGYGNENNIERTVEEFLALPNIEALHLEDQPYPKRCGHIKGKKVIPLPEFLGKLRAAIDTKNRVKPSCKIIARTDSFSAFGGEKDERLGGDIREAVKRLTAYADTGADYLWCEFPTPSDITAEALAAGVRKVHPNAIFAFNISPSFSKQDWYRSCLTEKYLNDLGYKLRFATYPALQESVKAVSESAREFKRDPIEAMRLLKRRVAGTPAESIMKLVNVDKYLANERKYDPRGFEKQSESDGFGTIEK